MHVPSELAYGDKAKVDLVVPRSILGSILRTDDPNILKLSMICENWRLEVFAHTDFLGVSGRPNILTETNEIILACNYSISDELMERCSPGGYQNAPLKLTMALKGCSKSCLLLKNDFIDTFDDKVLASLTCRMLLTDYVTRRSVQVPPWFRDAFSEYLASDVPMLDYAVQPLPPVTFSRAYRVSEQDIDVNDHVNNKVYMRECLRCVAVAPLIGSLAALRDAHRLDWLQRITSAETYHALECHTGDDLVVHGWQQLPDLLQFQIRRQDVTVYHCNIRFSLDAMLQAKL